MGTRLDHQGSVSLVEYIHPLVFPPLICRSYSSRPSAGEHLLDSAWRPRTYRTHPMDLAILQDPINVVRRGAKLPHNIVLESLRAGRQSAGNDNQCMRLYVIYMIYSYPHDNLPINT